MAFPACIDTYYEYVKAQMAKVNPAQLMGGMANARDWPETQPKEGMLYLLFLNAVEIGGTRANTLFEFVCQWNWVLIGADLTPGVVGANRGDRYRKNLQLIGDLRNANYPLFTPKRIYSVVNNVVVSTVVQPVEMVWWRSKGTVANPTDEKSGVVYGVAPVSVYGYDTVSNAVV